ncbi:MAG: glycerophosphodiester phosphodiesterase [Candidatus Aminicenantes bacterium]|jgi:glycerophosphoryl diester phosphodiesterase
MKKILIAHRGARTFFPENTLEAFEEAIRLNADMIELDVRRTQNNLFVVYHDEHINERPIKDLAYDDICKISRLKIPTVEDVLKLTRSRIKLDIELKEEGYEKEVVNFILKFLKEDEFVITSFNDNSLKIIKEVFPGIRTGLILGKSNPKNPFRIWISELFPFKRSKKINVDFLVPHWRLLKLGFLRRAKKHKLPIFVWTVNEENLILKFLKDKRIDGIVTDKIEIAVQLKQNSQNKKMVAGRNLIPRAF